MNEHHFPPEDINSIEMSETWTQKVEATKKAIFDNTTQIINAQIDQLHQTGASEEQIELFVDNICATMRLPDVRDFSAKITGLYQDSQPPGDN